MTGAGFTREDGLLSSGAVVRRFVRGKDGRGALPVLAGFGVPPRVGDPNPNARPRMPGTFEQAHRSHVALPVCGEEPDAVAELLVTATVSRAGGRAKDVALRYTVDGVPYRHRMPLTMVLCGSEVTNPDC